MIPAIGFMIAAYIFLRGLEIAHTSRHPFIRVVAVLVMCVAFLGTVEMISGTITAEKALGLP